MSEDAIVLRDYEESDAAGVARMWEESRDGWPPGFLGAVRMTAESVDREERLSGKLFTVLALEGDRVVGYNRVEPYGGETDAAYVALLNVVTDLHGKKIGKRLLLDGLEKVTKLGYYRLDLHTWSANTKAVPLYKKTGFFWVPETTVYMQNYMPFVLGRPEFGEFVGYEDWYSIQVRDLSVEPDQIRSPSGRRIFRYLFQRSDGDSLEVEFDMDGRVLSLWRDPLRSLSIERDCEKVFFGVPVHVKADLDGRATAGAWSAAAEIELLRDVDGSATVSARCIDVPYTAHDRAPRLTVPVDTGVAGGMELGLGFRAEDQLSVETPPIRRPLPGQERLRVLLRRNAGAQRGRLYASAGPAWSRSIDFDLAGTRYQQVEIDLPDTSEKVTELRLTPSCDGAEGIEERVLLVRGPFEGMACCETRGSILISRGLLGISALKRGGSLRVMGPGHQDHPRPLVSLSIPAGPPFWNSDFPYRMYDLRIDRDRGEICGETSWPSRPGWIHRVRYRLLEGGILEASAEVANGSDLPGSVQFNCNWWWRVSDQLRELSAVPFATGTVCSEHAYNMFPDGDQDFPDAVSELSGPWMASSGSGWSALGYFPGWQNLGYGNPVSAETMVEPGDTATSPVFLLFCTPGGIASTLGAARAMGWNVEDPDALSGFPEKPVSRLVPSGGSICVVNHARGSRRVRIGTGDGEVLADGLSSNGEPVRASLEDAGLNLLNVSMGGLHEDLAVFVASGAGEPILSEASDGMLTLENGALSVRMRPAARGHVFSVVSGGCEYLHSSDPEPGEFAWEKPWFGGIGPAMEERHGRPLHLEELDHEHSRLEGLLGDIGIQGWETHWRVDDERFGSVLIRWKIGLPAGLPLLHACMEVEPLSGGTPDREFGVCGNLAPVRLTCARRDHFWLGREHGGAWIMAGKWARVSAPDGAFVEVHRMGSSRIWVADYAREGCHPGVWSSTGSCRRIETVWLFGEGGSAADLSRVFRERG